MPRAAPTSVIEQRLTLGTYERAKIEELEQYGKRALMVGSLSAVALPMALVGAAGAISIGMVGFGLNNDLNKEAIRNILIGVPSIRRTRADGSEQTIDNIFFGVPIIGPLFGTGMRIGEKTAEATTRAVSAVEEAVQDFYDATGIPSPKDTADDFKQASEEVKDAGTDLIGRWSQFMGSLYGYR